MDFILSIEKLFTNPLALVLVFSLFLNVLCIWYTVIRPGDFGTHSIATALITKDNLSKQLIDTQKAFKVSEALRDVMLKDLKDALHDVQTLKYTVRVQEFKYKFLTEGLEKELWLLINKFHKNTPRPLLFLNSLESIIANHVLKTFPLNNEIEEILRAGVQQQLSEAEERRQRLIRDKSMYEDNEFKQLIDIAINDEKQAKDALEFIDYIISQVRSVSVSELQRPDIVNINLEEDYKEE